MTAKPWSRRQTLLGLLTLVGLAACQPQTEAEPAVAEPTGDQITQVCQGFEDQAACQQVVQSCLDSGGTFESIALVNSVDSESMFNIVCRGTDAGTDPAPLPGPQDTEPAPTASNP
ncbi:MAG: hypothetical protein KBC57_13465 [Neisseriaceae bacterium]|nr:hypothetical protein [Neisseriaceae bacterium]